MRAHHQSKMAPKSRTCQANNNGKNTRNHKNPTNYKNYQNYKNEKNYKNYKIYRNYKNLKEPLPYYYAPAVPSPGSNSSCFAFKITKSTRRLRARPSTVPFVATGYHSPYPEAIIRNGE